MSGAAEPSPTPFGTLESRAAVLNKFLPSRMAAGTGSTDGSTVRSPVMLHTGWPRMSGTQSAPRMQGPLPPQPDACVHSAPPGWLQNPTDAGQSLLVSHVRLKSPLMQRRLGGAPVSSTCAEATRTTLRER